VKPFSFTVGPERPSVGSPSRRRPGPGVGHRHAPSPVRLRARRGQLPVRPSGGPRWLAGDLARLDARGAHVQPPRRAVHLGAYALNVRVPAARRAAVRVRHVHAEARPLAADVADGSHGMLHRVGGSGVASQLGHRPGSPPERSLKDIRSAGPRANRPAVKGEEEVGGPAPQSGTSASLTSGARGAAGVMDRRRVHQPRAGRMLASSRDRGRFRRRQHLVCGYGELPTVTQVSGESHPCGSQNREPTRP